MEKQKGILIRWNECAGYGFVSIGRTPEGRRITRFLHIKNVERIDCEGGIPEVGSTVLFNERDDLRGPLAVDAEIISRSAYITANTGLKHLSGEPTPKSEAGQ
jgi:cold shock CspA family protein